MSEAAGNTRQSLLRRVDGVGERLARHAAAPVPAGLTAPDPPSGEQWDAGQVWAHIAEFIAYWIAQADQVLDDNARAGGDAQPVPFGRVKSDPERIAAIARHRSTQPAAQLATIEGDLDALRDFIASVPEDRWSAQGVHQTLGVMTLEQIVDEFLVGHLEQHADQLDGLAAPHSRPQS
jgi:hypothetical protein